MPLFCRVSLTRFFKPLIWWALCLPLLWIALNGAAVRADTYLIYGPQNYTRASGSPVEATTSFSVPNPSATHLLRIVNGDPSGARGKRVSSGEIRLNGEVVAGPRDFNQKGDAIEVPVVLQADNRLSVTLFGKPGGQIQLEILRDGNNAPVANAGHDQTFFVDDAVSLDGSSSTDADGDPLTYRWTLTEKPEGSTAALTNTTAVKPGFTIDRFGTYRTELTVSDGFADSEPDYVTIDTLNSPPVADSGANQTAFVGDTVVLDGSGSFDVDGDPLNYRWRLLQKPESSDAELENTDQPLARLPLDRSGHYVAELLVNDGEFDSEASRVAIDTLNSAPVAVTGGDLTAFVGDEVLLDGSGSYDVDGDALTYDWSLLSKPTDSLAALADKDAPRARFIPDLAGLYVVQLIAHDFAASSAPQTATVTVDVRPPNHPPRIVSTPPTEARAGEVYRYALEAQDPDGDPLGFRLEAQPADMRIDASGLIEWSPNAAGEYAVIVEVSDDHGGTDRQSFTVTVTPDSGDLPPDPATVAPPLSATGFTPLKQQTEFLYTGPDPVQTGVAENAIDSKRAAVVRGRVLDRENHPLPGVTISVKDHPEYGQTRSRADGWFDLAVNGLGQLILEYRKAGYLPAQRKIETAALDFAVAEDVVLVALDNRVTSIDLSDTSQPYQVAQGSVITDADGSRQATLLFPAGLQATVTLPDGSSQVLSTLNVRATEYTVGENGPKAMPGALPATSGYTYAVDLSVDEAIALSASRVDFDRPVPFYVDNFLDFPVGEIVPVGWYDYRKADWIPADNGKILKILRIESGLAIVSITPDDSVATDAQLARLGIDDAERARLAQLYDAGKTLWRVPLSHFTPWDCNWPYGLPPGATPPPDQPDDNQADDIEDPTRCPGCIIDVENQVLDDEIPIVDAPFNLHYSSRHAPGREKGRTLDIQITGETVPEELKAVDVTLRIAGQSVTRRFEPLPNQTWQWTWNGKDVYGRPLTYGQSATIDIHYRYDLVYYAAAGMLRQSFAVAAGGAGGGSPVRLIARRNNQSAALRRTFRRTLTAALPDSAGLGAWTPTIHHRYDPLKGTIYLGDGTQRQVQNVAGKRLELFAPVWANSLAETPDGTIYFSDSKRIRRILSDGRMEDVAGNGSTATFGSNDGARAVEVGLGYLMAIDVAADGTVYFVETSCFGCSPAYIRRVTPEGTLETVKYYNSDITDVDVGADGSIYIAHEAQNRISRLATDGSETYQVAEVDYWPWCADQLPDGTLLVCHTFGGHRLEARKATGGVFNVYAAGPQDATQDTWGNLYVAADYYNSTSDGLYYYDVATAQQTRISGTRNDPGPSEGADIGRVDLTNGLREVHYSKAHGGLLLAYQGKIWILRDRLAASLPDSQFVIPSEDGGLVYEFAPDGTHLRTLNSITGDALFTFTYGSDGRLAGIRDLDGEFTAIEHLSDAQAAITSANSHRTSVQLNSEGYLSAVTAPDGSRYQMTYHDGGLLASLQNPRQNTNRFRYDSAGNFEADVAADQGVTTLSREETAAGYRLTRTSAEGRISQFEVETAPLSAATRLSGRYLPKRTFTAANGSRLVVEESPDRTRTVTPPDGSLLRIRETEDPRFGAEAPYPAHSEATTPGGLKRTVDFQRKVALADPGDPLSLTAFTETITANGKAATRHYDAAARTWTLTSPAKRTATVQVNDKGRPMLRTLPGLDPISYAYDPRGRLQTFSQGEGTELRAVAYTYYDHTDPTSGALKGYPETVTDSENRAVRFEYDPAGRITRQVLPDLREIRYEYDANGNLTALTPPGRPAHLFDYTAVDERQSYMPPAVGNQRPGTRYQYNLDRQLERITRPDGSIFDLLYDSASGLLQTLAAPHGDTDFQYDGAGRLTSVTSPGDITLTYGYDGFLPTQETVEGPIAGSIARAYDNDFRLSSLAVNGTEISFSYDQDSLLTGAGSLALSRDPQTGFLTGTRLGNVVDTLSHNGFGEVRHYAAKVNDTPLFETRYVRDRLGRITQKTETSGGTADIFEYAYDTAGRLTENKKNGQTEHRYRYNENGNRTHENGVEIARYDDQDRLTAYGDNIYTYTANGELETKTHSAQVTAYDYDAFGNLRAVRLPDGRHIEYLVDGQNRRIGKKIDGQLVQGFLYQNTLNPVAELDANSHVVARFVYGDKANVPAYMEKNGQTYRILSDPLGSPRLVVNADTGEIAQRLDYDPWGNVTLDTRPGFQPFGFAGGLYDRDTRLLRFGARDYDPETGRWTAKDPILFAGGDTNLYGYVLNDPINWIDPNGLEVCSANGQRTTCTDGQRPPPEGTPLDGPLSPIGIAGHIAETALAACPLGRARGVAKGIDNSVLGKPRIGSANKTDPTHRFNDIIDNYAGDATKFDIPTKGPRGQVVRTSELRQVEGSLNGNDGVFEWIIDQGNVTHRRFIPGGQVTGFPNQIPKK